MKYLTWHIYVKTCVRVSSLSYSFPLQVITSSPAFLMIYSAYKLNKQGDNIQPWRSPFPIWNQSVVPCLTVASWPAYRFLKRQVRWSGNPISFRIFHRILHELQKTFCERIKKTGRKVVWKILNKHDFSMKYLLHPVKVIKYAEGK